MLKKLLSAVAAIVAAGTIAFAANTIFFTSAGDVVFPFSPPALSGAAGSIDNMAIGATTPRPGSFTTLASTSAPTGAGNTANFASPPPLGSTAPAAVTATTLRSTGLVTVTQGAPAAATVSATLTAGNLTALIITVNQGAAGASAQQLPLATDLDTALPLSVARDAFDFSVINISTVAAEAASLTTNTGWTLVGDMDVAANSAITTKSAGRFRARKTGTGAWTLYRLS
jgi:hypothetical protein